jgi:hypothetical protein
MEQPPKNPNVNYLVYRSQGAKEMGKKINILINSLIGDIQTGDLLRTRAFFTSDLLRNIQLKELNDTIALLIKKCGRIKKIGIPTIEPPLHSPYKITIPVTFDTTTIDINLGITRQYRIGEFRMVSHRKLRVPKRNRTPLILPFSGEFLVFWGGDTKKLNRHHSTRNQRYAFDFVKIDAQGRTHTGLGIKNEDYFAFETEVLCPGNGIVTDVIDGVRDNPPGLMNSYSAFGNSIFIQHSTYEISVLAHLKKKSIQVESGDTVKKGDVIALCGNSGNSSAPHIHYHLQNSVFNQEAHGIKIFFGDIILTGDRIQHRLNYSPKKGDLICTNG